MAGTMIDRATLATWPAPPRFAMCRAATRLGLRCDRCHHLFTRQDALVLAWPDERRFFVYSRHCYERLLEQWHGIHLPNQFQRPKEIT